MTRDRHIAPVADVGACCASVYSHPAARWLLGESFHPGGLPLTSRVAKLAGIGSGSRVLDAGSGRGTSAVHLAKSLGCSVVGVTLEPDGAAAGDALAASEALQHLVSFRSGDVQDFALGDGGFDSVLMECVLSILPDKAGALGRLHELLDPEGRLAITDVTVDGPLPDELRGILAVAGCVGDALSLDGYRQTVEAAGFTVDHAQDLPEVASTFLRDIGGKLMIAKIAVGLGKAPVSRDLLDEATRVLEATRELVARGALSYGLVIASRLA